MAVIRCPSCGKPNPDFILTCQYCETQLNPVSGAPAGSDDTLISAPADSVRCQACGRSNPSHLERCQYCEARLKPLLAEPAPDTPEASANQDPLARLRSTQTFEAGPEEPEADETAQAEPADWMNRLRSVGASDPAHGPHGEPEPDWMLTEALEEPASEPVAWLRDEPPPPANAPRAASSDDEELPDWLTNLGAPPVAPTPAQHDPSEPFFAPEPPIEPAASAEDELPDWLREQLAPKPAASPRPRKKMTDWLTAEQAAPPEDSAPAGPREVPPAPSLEGPEAALPSPEPPATTSTEPAVVQPADQTLVPPSRPRRKKMTDWLTPPEGGLPPQIPTPAPAEPEADLPDWLKAMQPIEEVPDWLRDVAAAPRTFNQPGGPPETPLVTEAPPAAVDSAAKDEAATPPAPPSSPTLAPTAENDLPAWLKALRGSPPPGPEDTAAPVRDPLPTARRQQTLPTWLKGVTGVLPPEPAIQPPAEAALIPPTEAAELTAPVPVIGTTEAAEPETDAADVPLPEETLPAEAAPMPAWLQPEAAEAEAEADEREAVPTHYELPDWLQPSPEALAAAEAELADTGEPEDAAALNAAELARAEEELPDWLRNLQAQTAEDETEARPEHQPGADVPDWLRPAGPPPSPPEPSETLVPPETPDWLQTLQSQSVATPSLPAGAEPTDLPPLDDETLAWLTATASRDESAEPAEAQDHALAAAWLDETAIGSAAALAGVPLESDGLEAAAEPTAIEDMPDWLKALRGGPTQEPVQAEAMPDWLRALRGIAPASAAATTITQQPEPAQPAEDEAEAEGPREPALAGEEEGGLPAWLAAMRPTDIEHPADAEVDSYEENVGVLAGMRGVLRAEPTVAQPHRSTTPVQRLVVSETHAAQAKVLAGLLTAEEAARPLVKQPSRVGQYLERWLVFLVLAAAILVPQFVLPDLFAAPTTISREAQAAFNTVNLAPINQPALVAFDYDPAQQGELGPGAVAIVTHLMSRGVPVVGVSTRPMGAGVAQIVLEQVAADLGTSAPTNHAYGTQYLNLGYISGGPVGLLQFAAAPQSVFAADFAGNGPSTALWTQPILRGVDSLSDFGLVVLITAAPDDARAWIEQSQVYAAGIPRLAVVSAGAGPMVQPYIEGEAQQLDGLVAGLVGAAQYEQQAGLPGLASRHWGALGGGLWAAVMLIAGGNAVYALMAVIQSRLRRRRQ